jgi:hypothetical protein
MNRARKRNIVIAALLGGLLGFAGQMFFDYFGWEFIDRGNGQGLQSLWPFVRSGGFDRDWAEQGGSRPTVVGAIRLVGVA